ncbi:hypothetical protein KGQ72_02575 [Patescibacteria group bacterium]|nr:hypothetical protein [Patescibacteria group bacterium]
MNKFLFALALLAFSLPHVSFADSYAGPYCFEDPNAFNDTPYQVDPQHIRGTCKSVTTTTVVSLDSALIKDYFLGWHEPACTAPRADIDGCSSDAKYSEDLHIMASSTAIDDGTLSSTDWYGKDIFKEGPLSFAVFDKKFFSPLLKGKFASIGESFSEGNFPQVGIYVLNKSELDAIGGSNNSEVAWELANPDSFQKRGRYGGDVYGMATLDSMRYAPYIHAPKWELIESQYVDVETSSNLLTSADLQVTGVGCGHWDLETCFVVPPTSPLKSVKNYWMYTKENGKLVLKWDKSVYGLDDGTVRTVTNVDKNVTAALLFGDTFGRRGTTTPSENASSTVAQTLGANTGFFSRVIGIILSWFRWL